VLGAVVRRVFFAGFDAGSGGNPDNGDEGDEAKCHLRMLESERDRDEIDEERKIVFALDGGVLRFEFACVAQTAADRQTQEEEAEAGQNHRRDVDGDRKGVHLLFKDIRGKEGEQREAEEEAEVGVEDTFVGLFGAMDQVVVIDPINASESKGDQIEAERGENGAKAGEAVLAGNLEFQHHDGDDDRDHSVGEGFEAGWGGDGMGHVIC
jgi:hypothetical protein